MKFTKSRTFYSPFLWIAPFLWLQAAEHRQRNSLLLTTKSTGLVLILSILKTRKAISTLEPPSAFELEIPKMAFWRPKSLQDFLVC